MSINANKRKRDSTSDFSRISPSDHDAKFSADFAAQYLTHSEGELTLAEALAQHNAGGIEHGVHDPGASNGQSATDTASAALHYSMTVPTATEATFLAQTPGDGVGRASSASFDLGVSSNNGPQGTNAFEEFADLDQLKDGSAQAVAESSPTGDGNANKPAIGSDEWHKVRRDNHKEVERRRRETINDGISELAKIVPGNEKNKGSILTRAVQFITQLKENESQNIEKWTLEKLLTEQAIAELSSSCDKLKAGLGRAQRETEAWRRAAERAGVEPSAEDRAAAERGEGLDDGDE